MDVTVYFPLIKQTLEGFQADCPRCGDTEKKLYYNTEKGVGCCFHSSCPWFKERGGVTERRLVAYFSRSGALIATPEIVEMAEEADLELPEEFELLDDLPKHLGEAIFDYLEGRGLQRKLIRRAKVGYCQNGKRWGYMIFPVFDLEGKTVYWQGRRFKQREPKFFNPPSSKKSELVYQINWTTRRPKRIILVESITNTLTLEHIEKTPNTLVLGILGSSLSDEQRDRVLMYERKLKELVIAMDPDATRRGVDMAEKFCGIIPAVKIALFPKGKDVNSVGRMKAWEAIDRATVYDPRRRISFLQGAARYATAS